MMQQSAVGGGGQDAAGGPWLRGAQWGGVSALVMGSLLSLLIAYQLRLREDQVIEARFRVEANERALLFQQELERELEAVHMLAAFFAGSQEVERGEFQTFTASILARRPAILALAWVPRVPAASRQEFVDRVRAEGFPEFGIDEFDASGKRSPAGERGEYFPVCFVEPREANAEVFGIDMAGEPERAEALRRAAASAELAVLPRLPPRQGGGQVADFLALLAMYEGDDPSNSPAARREALSGYVLAVYCLRKLVDASLGHMSSRAMDVFIFDDASPAGERLVFARAAGNSGQSVPFAEGWPTVAGGMSHLEPLEVGDRNWSVLCLPGQGYFAEQRTVYPGAVLGAGLVLTLCLAGYLRTLSGQAVRVDRLVRQGTADLREANQELQRQIGQRERAERALRESEAQFGSLAEALPLNLFRKDLQGRIVFANQRFCDTVGRPFQEIAGMTDHDLFPREMADKYYRDDQEVIQTGRALEQIEEHHRTDGEKLYVQVFKAPDRDSVGRVCGVQGMFWDISARRRAEEALRESEDRTRSIVESAHDAFVAMDSQGRIIDWNRQAELTFGWSREEAAGRLVAELIIPPSQREAHALGLARFLATGEARVLNRRLELAAVHRDGRQFPVEVVITPIRWRGGFIFGAFLHDVTQRRAAEDALRRSDARFRRLVEANIIGIIIAAFDGRVVEANDAFLQLVGYSRDELRAGQLRWDQLTPPEFAAADRAAFHQLQATGKCTPYEKQFVCRDGRRVPVLYGVTLLDETLEDSLCFVLDMTESKRVQADLEEAKEAAEAASRAKSLFLANMSHEIRTPLNAILGMTELVLDSRLAPEQREYLEVVLESGESLLAIIEDILDFSKIEAGKLERSDAPFDLRENLGDTLKSLAVRAHGKGLELAYYIHPDVPPLVVGDRLRLRQVLVNLVGNAIKFTDHGEVVVHVDRQEGTDREALLHFAVRDTGVGIPAEKHAAIFEAFEQVDNSSTRRFGGTGLGLAIASRLVDLMGGRIWVESEVDAGSTFHFTARFGRVDETLTAPPSVDPARLRGWRVLVVDDNATNRLILREMLQRWELVVEVVSSADEALASMQQAHAEGRPFQLVVTDANMPRTDGFELVRRIKSDVHLHGAVVMMLSSSDRPGDIAQCEKLGVANYLTKPVKQLELFDAVLAAAGLSGESEEAAAEPARDARRLRPLRVLLVEDSLVNQKLVTRLLEREGHTVCTAGTGREAVAAARGSFDVMLMDIQMPEMDGWEAAALIRADERRTGRHLPIIALTAHAMAGDRARCLEAGMDGYLPKPIRCAQLWEAMAEVLGPAALAPPPAEGQPEPNDPGPPTAAPAPARNDAPGVVDWSATLATVGGRQELLREVATAFTQEGPKLAEQLRAACAAAEEERLKFLAHTVKSSLGYFGVQVGVEQALELEQLAAQRRVAGRDTLVAALVQTVEQAVDEVSHYLDQLAVAPTESAS